MYFINLNILGSQCGSPGSIPGQSMWDM